MARAVAVLLPAGAVAPALMSCVVGPIGFAFARAGWNLLRFL
jgi:hypothetical protein